MADEDPTLNIPSILTLAVVSFFVIRWFLSSRSEGDGVPGQQPRGRRVDPAQVEQISQMFPQLSRRDIMWDLQLNGGSVAATTERILSGRGLDTPPPSYQPPIPQPAPQTRATTLSSAPKSLAENLITRYNLETKIKAEATESDAGDDQKQESAWSQNKSERQRLLQKRRDDMILAARRKMLEKEQVSKGP